MNWQVLGAAAALSFLTSVLFGLIPALEATRVDVMPTLKATRAGQSQTKRSFRRVNKKALLVVGQIAISLLILVRLGFSCERL